MGNAAQVQSHIQSCSIWIYESGVRRVLSAWLAPRGCAGTWPGKPGVAGAGVHRNIHSEQQRTERERLIVFAT